MLQAIIRFSIRNKLIIGLLVLFLIGYGSYQFTKLPIDAVPDITNNQVLVITQSPSLGAPDIERLITFPIEQALSNIPGKIEIRSFSRFGLSLVTVVFNDETDVYWARNQVTERLTSVQSLIPASIGVPELGPVTTGLGEIYQYVLKPKKGYEQKYDAQELRTIQDWIVRRQLLGVEGVADVSSFGGFLKQFEVNIKPSSLSAYGLSLQEVYDAIEKNNQNEGGSYIEKGSNVLFIRTEGILSHPDELLQIPIKQSQSGTPLLLKDVAEVKVGHATRYGAMVYNDQSEVAGAVIMMLKGGNSSEVIKNVKARIALIQQTLPEGVELEAFLDRTKMVNNAISTVEKNLAEGALIVVFILVLFLGNIRAGFLVASVIPLSMLFAVIMMNMFGVSGNLMSLGALDFGLIVDGAVIIVEAVMHLLTHHKKLQGIQQFTQEKMDQEVGNAAGRMMNAAVFGQLIILIVYLPIFSLQGIEGKMFKPMAQTVAFALAGAFILSLTYVPMMSALLLKNIPHEPNFADRMMEKLERWYKEQLQKALALSKSLVAGVLILFVLSMIVLSNLGGEFIPSLEEGDFAVETRVLTGSNLKVSVQSATAAAKVIIEEFPEVEKVVTKIGSGEIPTDPMPIEAMDMMIILKDKSEWTSASTFNELAEKMSEALQAVPGVTFGFQYPVQMRFNELMTGARQDVVCKIFGENLDTLAILGKRLGELSGGIEGAKDVYVESILGMPQIVVKYKRDVLAQYGLHIEEVNSIINTAFAGKKAGLIFEAERRFDLVLRMDEQHRKDISDIEELLVKTPNQQYIPLRQLAEVSFINGPNQIQREDAKRRMIVGFNVRGRDVQSIVQDLQGKVKDKLKLPPGYYITYGGSFENLEAAKGRLAIAVPISLILILVLLYFAFHSMKQGLLIYSAIPLSAMGGIFALALRGMPFSISAGIGFIALFGVAVLNGIVLVTEFNRQLMQGGLTLKEAVINGAALRLRPVLMTAAVASLGFLPMAISNGAGAEVQRPLATVVIGGLLIATFLTLFILPVLYIWFEHKKETPVLVKVILLLSLTLGSTQTLSAQTSITLEEAKQMLWQKNPKLEAAKLQALYAQKMRAQAFDIPNTNVVFERGQFNSVYTDNRFDVSQTFEFPTVYQRQRKVFNQQWQLAQTSQLLTLKELEAELSLAFTELIKIQLLENLYKEADKQMQQLLSLAKLRNKTGETDVTETAYLSQQRAETLIQLSQLLNDKFSFELKLQLLLDTNLTFVPKGDLQMPKPSQVNLSLEAAPAKYLQQQQQLAEESYRLEKARAIPNLFVGYGNLSIQGIGNDDKFYAASQRFQTWQMGVGVPLFFGSTQSKIATAKLGARISEKQVNYQLTQYTQQYALLKEKIQRQDSLLVYYKENALVQSIALREAANKQYEQGEINYLSFILLWNQYIQTQTRYLALVQNYNEMIIQLQKNY
jgi:heavy metal efflux system protein